MRRALLVLLLAACGDAASKPVPKAPPPAAPAPSATSRPAPPFEATFDDAALRDRVFDAAVSGKFEELSSLKLPPRCDRIRVAVRALHDQLLGAREQKPELPRVLDALDALAKAQGGASAGGLGPLVAAWRQWTAAQIADETELARRCSRCFAALNAETISTDALTEPLSHAPPAPPKSPSAAELAAVRAMVLVFGTPGDAVPQEIADAYDHAIALFTDLGWPGGFGVFADVVSTRLLKENPKSFRAAHLADWAIEAYGRSKDEVHASLMFLVKSDAAERAGNLRGAEYSADGAQLRIVPTGTRGRELFRVLKRHGVLLQQLGRQVEAARALGKAWEEAKWADLDVGSCVDVAAPYAASLFRLGRFAQAHDVALEASKFQDDAVVAGSKESVATRARLDEIAAECALELGRPQEAADLYRAEAARLAKPASSTEPQWGPAADDASLLAADAQAKSGDVDGAANAIAAVLAKGRLQPRLRIDAARALRGIKRFDDAARELSQAEKDGGAEFAGPVLEERARIAAARGDAVSAREFFRKASDLAGASAESAVAFAAGPMLDWIRMEADAGRWFEASELAGAAISQMRDVGLKGDVNLDRARKLYVDMQRRRLWFVSADEATTQRLADGPPGDAAAREDALLDQLLIRIELLFEKQKDAEKNADAAAESFPDDWRRAAARAAVASAKGGTETLKLPDDAAPRWKLLRDVVHAKPVRAPVAPAESPKEIRDVCTRCGDAEPEMRRWAVSKFRGDATPWILDVRRSADASEADVGRALGADEALVIVEPLGGHTTILTVRKGGVDERQVVGDAGLDALRVVPMFEPSPDDLLVAAKTFGSAVFADIGDAKRVVVSIPEPYGPLPLDLVPVGDGTLLDRCEVIEVASVIEFLRARARPVPPMLSELSSPYATLETRHAIVKVGNVDTKVRARFFALLGDSLNAGKNPAAALREAKLALRAEWKPDPDPKKRPAVPPWAAFVMRGAW